MSSLQGKTALVTGGTAGIGLAVARRFAAEGAHVFVTGRRQEALDSLATELGDKVTTIQADSSKLEDLDNVAEVIKTHGAGLDALFVNAGGGEFGALEDITWEHYSDTFNRNVGGTIFTVQKVLPVLNRGSAVVLASSNIDVKGSPSFSVYAASKAAIRSFARSWAAEFIGRGIRVNSIAPGPIGTPGLSGLAGDPEAEQALLAGLAEGVPQKRLGTPEEIADAVVFLTSDQSSYITGTQLYIDGGASQI